MAIKRYGQVIWMLFPIFQGFGTGPRMCLFRVQSVFRKCATGQWSTTHLVKMVT